MEYKAVLNDPENQKYFLWTSEGLKLAPDAPKEVQEAWQSIVGAGIPQRKARLNLLRRVRGLLNSFLG